MRSIGIVTLTAEELEFKIESMKVYEELKRFAKYFTDEEWSNRNVLKWYIYFDFVMERVVCSCVGYAKSCELYFESEEVIKKAIEEVGEERVKKYFLGVRK